MGIFLFIHVLLYACSTYLLLVTNASESLTLLSPAKDDTVCNHMQPLQGRSFLHSQRWHNQRRASWGRSRRSPWVWWGASQWSVRCWTPSPPPCTSPTTSNTRALKHKNSSQCFSRSPHNRTLKCWLHKKSSLPELDLWTMLAQCDVFACANWILGFLLILSQV